MPGAHPRPDRHHRPQLHHGTPLRLCRGAVSASRAPRSPEPLCPVRRPAVRTSGAQSKGRGAPRPSRLRAGAAAAAASPGPGPLPSPGHFESPPPASILTTRRRRLPSSRSTALPAPQWARSWLAPLRPSPNSRSVALPPLSGGHFLLHCYQGTGARKRPPASGSEGARASAQAPPPPLGCRGGGARPNERSVEDRGVERPQRRGAPPF